MNYSSPKVSAVTTKGAAKKSCCFHMITVNKARSAMSRSIIPEMTYCGGNLLGYKPGDKVKWKDIIKNMGSICVSVNNSRCSMC